MRSRNNQKPAISNNLRLYSHTIRDLLATKIVWAHHIGYGLPDYQTELSTNKRFYGDSAPLELYATNNSPRPVHGVTRALAAGINGLQIDIINGTWQTNNPFAMAGDFLADADATHTDPNPNKRFYLAPCIDTPGFSEADVKSYIQSYIAHAASTNHPSYAKLNGKYIIYFYGAYNIGDTNASPNNDPAAVNTSTAIWDSIRSWINVNNIPVFLVRDITFNSAYYGYRFYETNFSPWNNYFDASYAFDIVPTTFWKSAVPSLNKNRLLYFGGFQPAYNREGMWGGYVDPLGTSLLRDQLATLFSTRGIPWHNIVTWGDFVENTEVRPTTNWNKTRSELVNFYSARFRGVATIRTSVSLYVTSRMFVTVGDTFVAEAMVINPTTTSASVTVELYAADRTTRLSATGPVRVRGGTSGAATIDASIVATSNQIGSYVYAKAVSYDDSGTTLESVWSAPICVYAALKTPVNDDTSWQANDWPYEHIRTNFSPYFVRYRYYSIPAHAALSSRPTLTISGNPAVITDPINTPDNAKPTATVTVPTGVTIRSIELLQNTQLVARTLATDASSPTTLTAKVPVGDIPSIQIQVAHNVNPRGFYVARIITEDEKVSYSDPLYFS